MRISLSQALAPRSPARHWTSLRVVAPEDFVILKALATRDRDLEDARSVVEKLRGRLDETLMEHEIAALAAEITDHDTRGRFDKISAR